MRFPVRLALGSPARSFFTLFLSHRNICVLGDKEIRGHRSTAQSLRCRVGEDGSHATIRPCEPSTGEEAGRPSLATWGAVTDTVGCSQSAWGPGHHAGGDAWSQARCFDITGGHPESVGTVPHHALTALST